MIKRFLKKLLLIPEIRYLVGYGRFLWMTKIRRRKILTLGSDSAFPMTVKHNLSALKNIKYDFLMGRMDKIFFPLSQIETVDPNLARILIIGPRTENDILRLVGLGFRRGNIHAIDLISYSPWIDLGDMHKLPYPTNSFDIVIIGWTLSYSSSPQTVAQEIMRVLCPQGIVGIGVDHANLTPTEAERIYGYSIEPMDGKFKRVNSLKQVLDLFDKHVDQVFFSHDAPGKGTILTRSDYPQTCVVGVFSVQK